MSGPNPVPAGRRPVDLEAVARDDQLLDLLASGAQPDSQEPLIQALHTWRVDLSANMPETSLPLPAAQTDDAKVNGVQVNGARVNGARVNGACVNGARVNGAAVNGAKVNGAKVNGAKLEGAPRPADKPHRGRRRAIVAASLIGLSSGLGGVTVAAADAEPGSALWPITKTIFTEAAKGKEAEAEARQALQNARKALNEGRVDDAERYLDEAERKAGSTDSDTAEELRDEADVVRGRIDDKEDGQSEPKDPGDDGATGKLPTPSLPTPGGNTNEAPKQDDRQEREREPRSDDKTAGGQPVDPDKGKQAETSSLLVDPRILEF